MKQFFKFIGILLFLGISIYFCYFMVQYFKTGEIKEPNILKNTDSDLEKYGYSKEEIRVLEENLEENEIDELDKKYDYLSEFSKEKYFILENIERYEAMKDGTDYSNEEIVMRVNIGIDNEFYTNIKEVEDPDNLLVLVNKFYALPSGIEPKNLVSVASGVHNGMLRSDAAEAYLSMLDAAEKDGITIYSLSGYRSESYQKGLYDNYTARDGKEEADTYSARPNHSEHQTGLAMDVTDENWVNDESFEDTIQFEWLSKNAYKYGFILRYPKGKEYITGYIYEPWHYRYVGEIVAAKIYNEDITFEEYYVKYITSY